MYIDYLFLFSTGIFLFFSVIFILGYFENTKKDPKPKKYYSISTITPIWNEEKTIAKTLDALIKVKQNYKGKMEIIVVDNNSTDNSVNIVKNYIRKYPFIKLYFEKEKQGKSYAFNKGLVKAKGELVACVDADSYPEKNVFEYIIGYFDDPSVGAVTTKMVVKDPKNIVEYFQDIEYIYSNFLIVAFEGIDSIYVTRGPLSVYRTDLLRNIGGFKPADITPAEDMEVTFRIRKAGYKIKVSKKAKVYTSVMPTWKKLFWQRVRWNRGSLVNFFMHRDMALDTKYGFFSVVMMPIVSLSIAMIWVLIYYFAFRLYHLVYEALLKLYWYIFMGVMPDFSSGIKFYLLFFKYFIPLFGLLMVIVFSVWIFINAMGFFESREKLKLKRFILLLLSPFVYMPAQLYFWIAAIFLHFTKFRYRWR